jgi:hypothetical protein
MRRRWFGIFMKVRLSCRLSPYHKLKIVMQ